MNKVRNRDLREYAKHFEPLARKHVRHLVLGGLGAVAAGLAFFAFIPPTPAHAQGCVDPLGIPCTDTPPAPPCGVAGGPTCEPPEDIPPTRTPRPRSTSTNTATATPTATPTCDLTTGIGCPTPTASSTPTITLVPTFTPMPTPTPLQVPPAVDLISGFVGKLFPDPQLIQPLPSWMQPPNIEMTAVEITQAIQCLRNLQCADNSIPLYDGKLTMVRAYVHIKGGPYFRLEDIGGALCYGQTGPNGCANPIRPIFKIDVLGVSDPVKSWRGDLQATLDFVLPSYMVTGGATKDITVYVNYGFEDDPREVYYKDNYRSLTYQVESSEPISVRYHYVQNRQAMPNAGRIWDIYDFLTGAYPTGQVILGQGLPLLGRDYDWTGPNTRGCPKGWMDLLDDLYYMRNGSGPIPYGLVPAATVKGGASGCGYAGGMGSSGVDDWYAGMIAAQEIGHNLSRNHAPGCSAGGADKNYPGIDGHLDEVGTDVFHRIVFEPYWAYDYMGYCGGLSNTWTSIYTYQAIAGKLPAGAFRLPTAHLAAVALSRQPVLIASGVIAPTQAVVEHGFFLLEEGTPTEDWGAYMLDLTDASGKVLAQRAFDVLPGSDGEAGLDGAFHVSIPWVEGATSVVFRYQGQEIGRVDASRRSPVAAFTSPTETNQWGDSGPQIVAWEGDDADGNPLQYLLQFSADGGHTWEVLAPNLSQTSLEIDPAWIPGSSNARLRLVVSDGFNNVFVDSVPLQFKEKLPAAHISGPTAEDALVAGSTTVLQGAAIDLEDGFLGDETLSWSSDRDGVLGTGRTVILSSLSEGRHTLTLTAVDSDGNVTTESVDVVVQPAPVVEPAEAPSVLPCVGGAIVLAVIVLVGVFALGRRSRREAS